MKNKLNSIYNIPFLVCLTTLLLNDFYLKTEYHNWLTGKLSDFCGLYIFASFWSSIFPNYKRIIHFLTAFLFIIWKSPYSQYFIEVFSQNLYPIYRVIDVTDLIALLVLPISFLYKPRIQFNLNLNPIPLALLTFISFCATSMPEHTQIFNHPNYILFKSGDVNFETSNYVNDWKIHNLDSFVIIEIKTIRIEKEASIDDDFHKTKILKDLDLRILRELKEEYYLKSNLSDYNELRKSLVVNGITSLTLILNSYIDSLNFKDSRLEGSFKRVSKDNQLLIQGRFKNGLEDSIWTYYNNKNEILSKKYFQNGELIKLDNYESSKLISEEKYNTRNETVRNKYFHLAIILLIVITLLYKIIINIKKNTQNDILNLSHFTKITFAIGLPLIVLLIAKLVSSFIPNSISIFFINLFLEIVLVYIVSIPLFLIVFYTIKLKSYYDIIFYILLFSFSLVLIEEWLYLKNIINEITST